MCMCFGMPTCVPFGTEGRARIEIECAEYRMYVYIMCMYFRMCIYTMCMCRMYMYL